MKTKKFKELLKRGACPESYGAFVRSRSSPRKWAERVFRKAKVQMQEVLDRGYDTVWYESYYADGKLRLELGWAHWVLTRSFIDRLPPAHLSRMMKRVRDPYARLLEFLS